MKRFFTSPWLHFFFLLCLLASAVYFSGSNHELRKRLQYLTFDQFNRMHPRPALNDIKIVDIDEESLKKLGQFPWPRTIMADLVERLHAMGARVIAFDMVFAEPDRTSPSLLAQSLPDDYQSIKNQLSKLPDNDTVFAQSIKKAGNVVTGFSRADANETLRNPALPVPITFLLRDKAPFFDHTFSSSGLSTNIPDFSMNAAGNGSFMATADVDGIIRQVPIIVMYPPKHYTNIQPTLYPALNIEALRVAINPKARMLVKENKNKDVLDTNYTLKIGQYEVPLESHSKLWVYYRDIQDHEYISAHEILLGQPSSETKAAVKDKIILVGTSAEGLRDIRSTPLDIFVPGVEVHFNLIEQIMQGNFLKRPNIIVGFEAILIGTMGLIIILLAFSVGVIWLGCLSFLTIAAYFYGALIYYQTEGLLIDPVYGAGVTFILFVTSSILSYIRAEADRKQIKTAFGHYISPTFMEELTKDPDKLKLGGEVRELTVMFTDIRSFTKISEQLTPEELIQLMNDFLTPMSNLVMESRGTIDKYMGDAMMAFWNAPLDDPDHARQACLTALAMNEALGPVNEEVKKRAQARGQEPLLLSAGIGINTGPCSVGNMGSRQRFAYSCLGDAVNLASRLEGQTKTYGVNTLIGEDTYAHVKDFACLELDLIQVIGRQKPVKVYTLIGDNGAAQKDMFKTWQSAHNAMLAAYRAADFDCAAKDCKEAREFSQGTLDKVYDLYTDRIADLIKNPPAADWDGVFVAKSK